MGITEELYGKRKQTLSNIIDVCAERIQNLNIETMLAEKKNRGQLLCNSQSSQKFSKYNENLEAMGGNTNKVAHVIISNKLFMAKHLKK